MSSLEPKVVRIRRKVNKDGISVVVQDCDVYIGRRCTMSGWDLPDSKWANPFPAKKYGVEQCLTLYRNYIMTRIESDPITYDLRELCGKTLGCWCGTGRDVQCHGNVLIDIMRKKGIIP